MSEKLIDVRTPLAVSKNARVDLGRDGVLHVLAGPVTVHMDRASCEELTTTLACAMVALARLHPKNRPPVLALVGDAGLDDTEATAKVRARPTIVL
jgi:hypothetical protein